MTVIRDAVIRIRTERSGPSGGGFEARAFTAEAKAANEVAVSVDAATDSVHRHTESVTLFGNTSAQSFTKAGKGALQLAKAMALLAVSGEEDAQKIAQGLVKIEVAVQAVSGAYKLLSSSVIVGMAASLTPVGAAISVVSTLVIAGAAAWKYWGDSAQDAANRATRAGIEAQKTYAGILQQVNALRQAEQDRRLADENFAAANAITPEARKRAFEAKRTALGGELSAVDKERSELAAMDVSGQSRATQAGHLQIQIGRDQEAMRLLQERAQVERDLLDLRKQERQEALQKQQQAVNGLFSFIGGGYGGTVSAAAARANEAANRADEQSTQKMIDSLNRNNALVVEALQAHEQKLRTLER